MYVIVEAEELNLTMCCLCHAVMQDPIWLPCSDAFCKMCLDECDSCACPTCGEAIDRSSDGVGCVDYNRLMSAIIEVATDFTGASEADVCQAVKKSPDRIDDKWQKSLQCLTETIADLKKTNMSTVAAVEEKKVQIIDRISVERDEAKKRIDEKKCEMKKKIDQLAEIESNKVEAWFRDQSEELQSQCDNWKSSSPSLRARRRWVALAEQLIAKGNDEEWLTKLTPLSDRLAGLQEPVSDMPTLSCDEVFFKPSETSKLTIGSVEIVNRADAATDFGMCTIINHIHISDLCINLHIYYILCLFYTISVLHVCASAFYMYR